MTDPILLTNTRTLEDAVDLKLIAPLTRTDLAICAAAPQRTGTASVSVVLGRPFLRLSHFSNWQNREQLGEKEKQ